MGNSYEDAEFLEMDIHVKSEERKKSFHKTEFDIKIERNDCVYTAIKQNVYEDAIKSENRTIKQDLPELKIENNDCFDANDYNKLFMCEELIIKPEIADSSGDNINVEELNPEFLQSEENPRFSFSQSDSQTKHKGHINYQQLPHLKVFNCLECDYKSKHKSNLGVHKLSHKGIQFNCSDYRTIFKHSLKRHVWIHNSEKLVCSEYDFQTNYKSSLKSHMVLHRQLSKVEMFSCDKCDYQTKYKHGIKSHLLRHRELTKVEMFNCNDCDYQTKYKCNLKRHVLQHKGQKCNDCEYQTNCKDKIKKHMCQHKQSDFRQRIKVALKNICGETNE